MSLLRLKRHWPVLALLAVNLLIGLLVVRDYGLSADEPRFIEYAHQSLQAYRSWIDPRVVPSFGRDDLRYYGPAYAILTALAESIVRPVLPGFFEPAFWHFSYFVQFQLAGLCLYFLARRWFSGQTAFALTALFLFQPLLWGHAFINPKDIPFLLAFSACVTVGLWAVDRLPVEGEPCGQWTWSERWSQAGAHLKRIALGGTAAWVLVTAGIWLGWGEIIRLVEAGVRLAVSGENRALSRLLHLFVNGALLQPVENYVSKALRLSAWMRTGGLALAALLALLLYHPIFPELFGWLRPASVKNFLRLCLRLMKNPAWLLAGLTLGLATATRVLGPWAGALVMVSLLARLRDKALPALAVYILTAALTATLAWPFLWPDPLGRFLESLNIMSAFPWQGKVLFDGVQYGADQLPWRYLPVLLALQLTEPVLILGGLGLFGLGIALYRKKLPAGLAGLIFGWSLLPLLLIMLTRKPLYDNFRQLLFLLPPLFLLCGVALELIPTRRWVYPLLLAAALVPGLIPLVHLHPYQYVYYNHLTGGLAGAAGRFETDYWATSYAEAQRFVNQVAPAGASVLAWTFPEAASPYARPDLRIGSQTSGPAESFDYAVLSSRGDKHLTVFSQAAVIFSVGRDGVVFSVVKELDR